MRPTRRSTAAALALLAGLAAGCDRFGGGGGRSYQLSAAGAQPASAFFIGPQPGPDRPFPEVRNPFAGDRAAMMEGRRWFVRYNCAGCHGDHAGGGMGPSLRDTSWIYGSSEANIFASIAQGRAYGMPAWGSKLPQDHIWKLVAYITSLRTPHEPMPPR